MYVSVYSALNPMCTAAKYRCLFDVQRILRKRLTVSFLQLRFIETVYALKLFRGLPCPNRPVMIRRTTTFS